MPNFLPSILPDWHPHGVRSMVASNRSTQPSRTVLARQVFQKMLRLTELHRIQVCVCVRRWVVAGDERFCNPNHIRRIAYGQLKVEHWGNSQFTLHLTLKPNSFPISEVFGVHARLGCVGCSKLKRIHSALGCVLCLSADAQMSLR